MTRAFATYPQHWRRAGPDSNIEHRRVPNLETFWNRQGARLWPAESHTPGFAFPAPLQPGDVLTWRTFPGGGPHVAIVAAAGHMPRIVQNFGWGGARGLAGVHGPHAAEAHYRWTADLPRRGAV